MAQVLSLHGSSAISHKAQRAHTSTGKQRSSVSERQASLGLTLKDFASIRT
jgi:hypothetical protein